MAYYVEGTGTETIGAASVNFTPTLGAHESGDLLLCFVAQNSGGTTITTATSGWTIEAGQAQNVNMRSIVAWKVAASGAETNPTFTGASSSWSGYAVTVRDAPASSPISVSGKASSASVQSIAAAGSLSTGSDADCLAFYYLTSNSGAGPQFRFKSNEAISLNTSITLPNDSRNLVAYHQMGAAGNIPTPTGYGQAVGNLQLWSIAIKNDSGGITQPYATSGLDEIAWYGNSGSYIGTITWATPDNFAATVNSIATTTASSSPVNASDGVNWGTGTSMSTSENFATPTQKWVGAYHPLTFPNLTGKILSFEWLCANSSSAAQYGNDGWIVGFRDASGNYACYQIAPKLGWVVSQTQRFTFEPGVTTAYATSGSIDWTAVTGIAYLGLRNQNSAGSHGMTVKNLVTFDKATIYGGGAAYPATFKTAYNALSSCGLFMIGFLQGAAQILSRCSVQVGHGTNPTYFDSSASSFEMPAAYNGTSEKWWKVAANKLTLGIYASSADTINMAAGVVSTPQQEGLTVNASSSTSAEYSFAGTSFVGWAPTWKTGVPASNCTFKSCGIIDFKGADIENVIANTGTGTALISASDGFSATGCTFTASATAVYGIRIADSGGDQEITLEDTTFTGFTKDIDVTDANGAHTITINLADGQATPTYQTAGAVVSLVSSPVYQSVTISGATAGTRIQIYDTTSSTELYNGTPTFPYTWTDGSVASATRAIRLRAAYQSTVTAKKFIDTNIGTCAVSGAGKDISYLVTQEDDTTYIANAIDGSGVTDITIEVSGGNRVKINKAGGSVTWPQIYAYQVYWQFTSTGIAQETAFIDAPDTANYLLTDFDIKNTHASVPLTITGGWGRDSVTLTVAGCIDTTGTSIFPEPDHVVAYATGSALTAGQAAQLTAIEGTTANLTFNGTNVNANIVQVNELDVDGAGTEIDPWGPV